jgi:predicted acylesterase/phospholipase RssA
MSVATSADKRRVDLVFEGGGVKGIGLAGAFCHLDAEGYQPQRVGGHLGRRDHRGACRCRPRPG